MRTNGIPMMVSVTKGSETHVLHFTSLRAVYRYLRDKGCKISNSTLTGLEYDDILTLSTPECTYDIEREDIVYGYKKKKRKN